MMVKDELTGEQMLEGKKKIAKRNYSEKREMLPGSD